MTRTLIPVPEGYKYISVTHMGEIKIEAVKDVPNGAEITAVYEDEFVYTESK